MYILNQLSWQSLVHFCCAIFLAGFVFLSASFSLMACSISTINVINGNSVQNVIGTRAMDFEVGINPWLGKGVVGDENTSHLNVGTMEKSDALS